MPVERKGNMRAALALKGKRFAGARVVAGYSAPYAARVHEDLQAFHRNGQAKYLEVPARIFEDAFRFMVIYDMSTGKSLEESLMRVGLKLLAESQELVPVDTGFLKRSGYVEVEVPGTE